MEYDESVRQMLGEEQIREIRDPNIEIDFTFM